MKNSKYPTATHNTFFIFSEKYDRFQLLLINSKKIVR